MARFLCEFSLGCEVINKVSAVGPTNLLKVLVFVAIIITIINDRRCCRVCSCKSGHNNNCCRASSFFSA